MAIRVPVYQRRVQQAQLPGFRERGTAVDAQARGDAARGLAQAGRGVQALGQGVASAGDAVTSQFQRIQQEQNDAALNEAYVGLAGAKQHLLDDPTDGLVARKGKDALAQRDAFTAQFAEQARAIREGLPSDRVKQAFDQMVAKEALAFEGSVDRHVARESEELANQALDAALSTARGEAVAAIQRGGLDGVREAEDAIGKGLGALDARAEVLGWSPEFANKQRRDFETAANLSMMDAALEAGNHRLASDMLETAREYLDADAIRKSNIEAKIRAAAAENGARELADNLYATADGDVQTALAALESTAAAQADSKLMYDTRQNILQRGFQKQQANKLHDAPILANLELDMREGRGVKFDKRYEDLTDEGKNDWRKMAAAHGRSRSSDAKVRRQQDDLGDAAKSFYKAQDLDVRTTWDISGTTDAIPGWADLTEPQRNEVRALWQSDREKLSKVRPTDVKTFNSEVRRLSALSQLKGWSGSAVKRGSQADSFNAFMNDHFMATLNENGRAPTPQETRQAAADFLLRGEIKGTGFADDDDARKFEAIRRGQGHLFYTRDFEAENQEMLRQMGMPATDAAKPVAAPSLPTASKVRVRLRDGRTGSVPIEEYQRNKSLYELIDG